jgi:RNA recognition motif-containing protein
MAGDIWYTTLFYDIARFLLTGVNMKLIILNLPREFTQSDLAALFAAYGELKVCNLVIDDDTGSSKGFGFVSMSQKQDAEIAVEKLHGSKIGKNKVRVKLAK